MSGPRRVGGRFVTTDEHTTYTRALVAPAAVWEKQWTIPSGLPQDSKYKILKWVKVDSKQDFSEESDSTPDGGLSDVENDKPTLELPPVPALRSQVSFISDTKDEADQQDVEMMDDESSLPSKPPAATSQPSTTGSLSETEVAQVVESEMSGMSVDGRVEGGNGRGEGAQAIVQDESLARPSSSTSTPIPPSIVPPSSSRPNINLISHPSATLGTSPNPDTPAASSVLSSLSLDNSIEPLNSPPKPDTATVNLTGGMGLTQPGAGEDPAGEGARIGGGVSGLDQQTAL